MLFSTQIPSVLNAVLASFCLLRGISPLTRWQAALIGHSGQRIDMSARIGLAFVSGLHLALAIAVALGLLWTILFRGILLWGDGEFGRLLIAGLRAVSLYPI